MLKLGLTISGIVLGAAAVVVTACSSSSSGSGTREAVCGTDPSGRTCTCNWQAPAGGNTSNTCNVTDPQGACCQDPDWKQADNSKCVCIPPVAINCFYSGAKSVCSCLNSPTAPSDDFLPIAECDAPFPGFCCKALPDAGVAGASQTCECSGRACHDDEVQIANCHPSTAGQAACGATAIQVDSCK